MSRIAKKVLAITISSILFITSCSLYILTFMDKTLQSNIAFGFLLFALVALCTGLIFSWFKSSNSNVLINAGLGSCTLIYFVFTIIMLLLSNVFNDKIHYMVALEISGLAVFLIVGVLIVLSSLRIDDANEKTMQDRKLMQICEDRIYDLITKSENKQYLNELNEIYESIKYCDKIGESFVDEKIVGAIIKLEKQIGTEQTTEIFENINALFAQRSNAIANNKRGGF